MSPAVSAAGGCSAENRAKTGTKWTNRGVGVTVCSRAVFGKQEVNGMPQKLSQKDSTALYFVKVMSSLTVIASHISVISDASPTRYLITSLWDMMSTTSIGCFFIVGGILYSRSDGDSGRFWKRKLKTIGLPWLVCAVLSYVYRYAYGHSKGLWEFFPWAIGYGNWMYFLPVYVFCFAFFKPIWDKPRWLWGSVALTVGTLLVETIVGASRIPWLADYQNPLNWVGFFGLGILLRRRNLTWSKWFTALCVVCAGVFGVLVYRGRIFNFFHVYDMMLTVSTFFIVMTVGRWLADTRLSGGICWIGGSTFCIYLYHIICLMPVKRRFPEGFIKDAFLPVIGLAIMLLLIEIGKAITRKLPFGDKIRMMVGLR